MAWLQRRPLLAVIAVILISNASAAGPSRLSMDFSSSLIVSPDNTPASVLSRMDALLQDMTRDGVNNVCTGRYADHVCGNIATKTFSSENTTSFFLPLLHWIFKQPPVSHESASGGSSTDTDSCYLCLQATAAAAAANGTKSSASPCTCSGPGGNTRCTCTSKLTGQEYFNPKLYGLEYARVLVEAVGETLTIDGGIHANFNSTVRFRDSKLFVTRNGSTGANQGLGTHDLELDESHLDLMQGSELHIEDDGDLEVEDAGSLWLSDQSKIVAKQASNIQIQLAHVLVEGGSSISVEANSGMNFTQEYDFTPAQAAAVCDKPFEVNPAAEACAKDPASCKTRLAAKQSLTSQERQALEMMKYPPALDRWGRQAFDYADDDVYDDNYDQDYTEFELEAGTCLSADVCGTAAAAADSPAAAAAAQTGHRRLLLSDAHIPVPAPLPAASEVPTANLIQNGSATGKAAAAAASDTAATAAAGQSTASMADHGEISSAAAPAEDSEEGATVRNSKDTVDGTGYDPEWGQGPYGESLCDAPPFKAFNYYGVIVRGGSHIRIASNSSWSLFDHSRVFIHDSSLTLEDGARLNLYNSTIVLINSVLTIKGGSQIHMERFSGLHLFQSKVLGDNSLYGLPANSTWQGQPWVQRGDYRSSPGGGLPVSMGVQPGVQLGVYPLRVFGFDLDARLMPAAGCNCKKPRGAVAPAAAAVVNVPGSGNLLENLI